MLWAKCDCWLSLVPPFVRLIHNCSNFPTQQQLFLNKGVIPPPVCPPRECPSEWWQPPFVGLIYNCRKPSRHHISRHVVVHRGKKSKKGVTLVAAPLSDWFTIVASFLCRPSQENFHTVNSRPHFRYGGEFSISPSTKRQPLKVRWIQFIIFADTFNTWGDKNIQISVTPPSDFRGCFQPAKCILGTKMKKWINGRSVFVFAHTKW